MRDWLIVQHKLGPLSSANCVIRVLLIVKHQRESAASCRCLYIQFTTFSNSFDFCARSRCVPRLDVVQEKPQNPFARSHRYRCMEKEHADRADYQGVFRNTRTLNSVAHTRTHTYTSKTMHFAPALGGHWAGRKPRCDVAFRCTAFLPNAPCGRRFWRVAVRVLFFALFLFCSSSEATVH